MASKTELEELYVRMTGDATGYLKMLKDASDATKTAADNVQQQKTKMEGFADSLKNFGAGLGLAFGGDKVKGFLTEAKGEWFSAETAAFRLSAVLKTNGRDVDELAGQYADFATQIQKATVYSDEQILDLVRMAETFDLTGASAKKATKEALALSSATGVGAESAMRMTRAMVEGNTEQAMMFARMIPQLRGVKDEMEFVTKYRKLVSAGEQTMQDELKTGAGRAKNFENAYSDVQEEVGKYYAQILNPIKLLKKEGMELWGSMSEGAKKTTVAIAGWGAQLTVGIGVLAAITSGAKLAITSLAGVATTAKAATIALASNPITWIAVAVVGIRELGKEITKSYGDLTRLKDLANEGSGMSDQLAKQYESRTDAKVKGAKDKAELDAAITYAEKNLEGARRNLERVKEEQDAQKSSMLGRTFRPSVSEAGDASLDKDVKEQESMVNILLDSLDKLKKGRDDFAKQTSHGLELKKAAELAQAAKAEIKALEDEVSYLGKLSGEIDRLKAIAKGATPLDAMKIADLSDKLAKGKDFEAATTELKKYIETLKEERDLLGMTEQQKKLHQMDRFKGNEQYDAMIKEAREQAELTRVATEQFEKEKAAKDQAIEKNRQYADSIKGVSNALREVAAAGSAESVWRIWNAFSPAQARIADGPAREMPKAPAQFFRPNEAGMPQNRPAMAEEKVIAKLDQVVTQLKNMVQLNLGMANFSGG